MRTSKQKIDLLEPDELHALSFQSKFASDSGFFSVYETAEYDEKTKKLSIEESKSCNKSYIYIADNGIVDFDGKNSPYSRKKFVDNPYYACIGCSYSVAKGLPVQYSWPSIVELFTGRTVNNYSEVGACYRKLSSLLMDASARFGAPKHVLALMPDPYRVWFPYSWLRAEDGGDDENKIVFGHGYWEPMSESYQHNHMSSGNALLRFVDHMGKKHIPSPDAVSFSNTSILYSLQKIFESMEIPFSSMTWFSSESPELIDVHDVFTIKRNPDLNLETSTEYVDVFREMEKKIGGDGRWRRYGSSSRSETCDHVPITKNQENFWYQSINSSHPGLHDQIHYAEQLLDTEIPASLLEEIP